MCACADPIGPNPNPDQCVRVQTPLARVLYPSRSACLRDLQRRLLALRWSLGAMGPDATRCSATNNWNPLLWTHTHTQ